MAGRILNRRELRKQADEAEARESPQDREATDEDDEPDGAVADDDDEGEGDEEGAGGDAEAEGDDEEAKPAKKKAKPKAPPKARKPRKPKAPPRMRARWGVFDASMKQVAIFDYNQRAAADEKAVELAAKKNGTFFLQIVKEPMPEPEPEGATGPQAK
jgi:hypothetical protein